jgi:hypothetical protein
MATLPSKEKLERFGLDHFNYINLVFGDQNIRQHVMEATAKDRGVKKRGRKQYIGTGKNRKLFLKLATVKSTEYDNSFHHICRRGTKTVCSGEMCYQHLWRVNDTLCQSYSMMTFLGYLDESDENIDSAITFSNPLTGQTFTESKYLQPSKNLQNAMADMWLDLLINKNPTVFLKDDKGKKTKIPWTLRQAICFALQDENFRAYFRDTNPETLGRYGNEENVEGCLALWRTVKNTKLLSRSNIPHPDTCIISKIIETLLNWKEYGWLYFKTSSIFNPVGLELGEIINKYPDPRRSVVGDNRELNRAFPKRRRVETKKSSSN